MNQELAKELKDAGFPQLHSYFMGECERCGDIAELEQHNGCVPTLSELIEACGEDFVLERVNSQGLHPWTAGTFIDREGEIENAHTAETPEEAAARLWLTLNQKTA